MQKLYGLKYNNYYNRIYKKENTLQDYLPFKVLEMNELAFNYNDGITTSQVVNIASPSLNYVVIVDDDGTLSRWFVLESTRTRKGQYVLSLRRDVIADYSNLVFNAPCFIEKAIVNYNNDLIFNSESMDFNQIKTSETLLADKSKTPWIVGYYVQPKDTDNKDIKVSGSVSVDPNVDFYETGINSTQWNYKDKTYISSDKATISYSVDLLNRLNYVYYRITFNKYGDISKGYVESGQGGYSMLTDDINKLENVTFSTHYDYNTLDAAAKTALNIVDTNDILKYKNKFIQFKDGIFKVEITENEYSNSVNISESSTSFTSMDSSTKEILTANGITTTYVGNKSSIFKTYVNGRSYTVSLIASADIGITYEWEIPISSNKLQDQPYKMFAIPLNSVKVVEGSITNITTKNDVSLQVANNIVVTLGSGCYDIQLLPYCPITEILTDTDGKLSIDNTKINVDYSYITYTKDGTKSVVGIMFFPKASSFNNRIILDNPITITEPKIQSECDMYRLCSPNYNGVFEFNAAKNGGIHSFDIACTYLPYNPYIHVAPDFGRLYGTDYNDDRGLICGGNFSLPIVNDAWVNYQINNKNYANIFDRQIQSMEIKNSVQREQEIWSIASGTIGGTGAGYQLGGKVGAAIGGTASLLGGIRDYQLNETLRQEGINYTKDLFGYNLGNIKALPNSLARGTSYNIDNKYFPFLEYYTCSDVEKEALRNKIKYNGMTIMTIGTIQEYLKSDTSYIKGQIIRLEPLDEDYHLATAIYDEINKGLYI